MDLCTKSAEEDSERNKFEEIETETYKPLDGGWGWLCVAGCMFMHFLLGGLTRSFGVIYLQILDKFESSAAVTAWIGGLSTAIRMGCSPLATSLSVRFTTRKVVIFGGVLIGLGCILTALATNVAFLFFSYGVVTGLGGTLIYSPGIVIVGQYFEKKRGTATGLSSAGSGLGAFCFPPVVEIMFEHYGYFGGLLILSSLMFNNCVSGALYRPIRHSMTLEKEVAINAPENNTNNDDEKCITISAGELTEKSSCNRITKLLCNNKYLKLSLLKDPSFLLFSLSSGFITTCYVAGQMLVPAHATDQGIPRNRSVLLLSIVGISDMFGRVTSGFLVDRTFFKRIRIHLYNIAILGSAGACFSWSLCRNFGSFVVAGAFHGVFTGFVVGQRAVIASDLFGVKYLSSSFGLTVFVQGAGILIGPAVAGYLKDKTGFYVLSYVYCGVNGLLSAVLCCCINITQKNVC